MIFVGWVQQRGTQRARVLGYTPFHPTYSECCVVF
jgi:hypothetical protein